MFVRNILSLALKKMRILERLARESQMPTQESTSDSPGTAAIIRTAQPRDILRCSEIFVTAYREVYGEQWTVQRGEGRLTEILHSGKPYCLVLMLNGVLCGFLFARPYMWHDGLRLWIEELVLDAEHRGKGWGRQLLSTLDGIATTNEVRGFSLISEEHSRAHELYVRIGYTTSPWIHLERAMKDGDPAERVPRLSRADQLDQKS
jgi:GNAT superfamily N-acetyltransferase